MTQKIRILFFIEGNGGGAITHTLTLAKGLDPSKVASTVVFSVDGPSVELARELGLDCRLMARRFDLDFGVAWRLARMLKHENIDILHTHTITGNFYARWSTCLTRRKPILITTTHSFVIDEMRGETRVSFRDYLRYKREVWLSGLTDQFIAVSEGIKNRLLENRVPERKINVISNAITVPDIAQISSRQTGIPEEFSPAPTDAVVAIIGRLVPLKNHQMFLASAKEALKHLPEARFLIIGDGVLRDSLERQAEELGIRQRVIFTGWQNHLAPFYQRIDVLVQCSFTESQGLTLLEAMSFSKPVVATDVNDVGKTVINGKTGLLIPSGDVQALTDAIVSLIRDKELAGRLGEAGRSMVENDFCAERMIEKTLALYEQLVAQRART